MPITEMESTFRGPKKNWLTNFKYQRVFSILYLPSVVIVLLMCFMLIYSESKIAIFKYMSFFIALTTFCQANNERN